jgi:hypothetical protein
MSFGKIKADTIAYTHPTTLQETDASVSDLVDNANLISANTTNISTNTTNIAAKAPLASPQFTGIPVATGDGVSTDGQIQLNCSQNSHGVKIKSPPHSAAASYTLTLPDDTGTTGEFLKTDGSGALSWDSPDLSAKADLDSPDFTGVPLADTAASGTSTRQIATTAFVAGEVRTDSEITGLANTAADNRIAFDLAAATPTIQAYDADTAKTDVAQTYSAPQRGTVTEYTGTAFSIDFSTTNNFVLKPSGNYSVTVTGLTGTEGQCGSIFIQPTAAATITGSWPTTMRFVGGSAGISLTGTSASIDRIDYIVLDDTSSSEVITCNVTANYVV